MPPVIYLLKCTVIFSGVSSARDTQRERERESARGELKFLKTGTRHDHEDPSASSMNSLSHWDSHMHTRIFWHAESMLSKGISTAVPGALPKGELQTLLTGPNTTS